MASNEWQDFRHLRYDPNATGNRKTFTLSWWVRRNSEGEGVRNGMWTWDEGSGSTFFGTEFTSDSYLRIYSSNNTGGSEIFTSTKKFRDHQNWMHIVVQADTTNSFFSTTNKIRVYIDGVYHAGTTKAVGQDSSFVWGDGSSSRYMSVGCWTAGPAGGGNPQLPLFGSMMDMFYVDGTVMSPDKFGKSMNGEWRPQAPATIRTNITAAGGFGTLGFYIPYHDHEGCIKDPLEELSGNYGLESTRNWAALKSNASPNTTLKNSLWFPNSNYADNSYGLQTKQPMGASNVIGSSEDFTIEFWIKKYGTAGTNDRILGCRTNDGGGNCLDIYMGSGGRTLYDFGNSINYGITLRDSQWDHVALCRQSGTGRYYLNGVQQKSESNSFVYGHADYKISIGGPASDNNLGNYYGLDNAFLSAFKIRKGTCSYPNGTTFTPPSSFSDDSGTIFLWQVTDLHSFEPTHGNTSTSRGDWYYFTSNSSAVNKDNPRRKFAVLEKTAMTTSGDHSESSDIQITDGGYRVEQLGTSNNRQVNGSMAVTEGKWYYEGIHHHYTTSSQSDGFGWQNNDDRGPNSNGGQGYSIVYRDTGGLFIGNHNDRTDPASGTWAAWQNYGADVIGVAIDLDSSPKTIKFYKNGVLQGDAGPNGLGYKMNKGAWTPIVMGRTQGAMYVNFGQDATLGGQLPVPTTTYSDASGIGEFRYQPPSGYKCLCDENLPNYHPGGQYFGSVTWTGNNTSGRQLDLGFQPDCFIDKRTNYAAGAWFLGDSNRGWTKYLYPDNSASGFETSESNHVLGTYSNGVTLGSDGNINNSSYNYIGYGFKKCDAFDIVAYTGGGAGATVSHNLGGVPELIIAKSRTNNPGNINWSTNGSIGNNYLQYGTNKLLLQTDSAVVGDGNEITSATSTTFTVGGSSATSYTSDQYIAMLFRSVPGLSRLGTYFMKATSTGEGANKVHCGFRPEIVIIKRLDSAATWCVFGAAQNDYQNPQLKQMRLVSTAEDSGSEFLDIYSDGFAPRNTAGDKNASGGYFMYIALAGAKDDSNYDLNRGV